MSGMKDMVLIKSFSKGIALHLNAEAAFEDILKELAYKFSEARSFFGTACSFHRGESGEQRGRARNIERHSSEQ